MGNRRRETGEKERHQPRLRGAVALGLIAALVAIFPTGASAGAHANERHSPGQSAAFTVAGSNGYALNFKSEKGLLSVVVSRGRPGVATISPRGRLVPRNAGNGAWTTYFAQTPKDPGTIEADLGPLGKVSFAFQPSGEKAVTNVDLEDKSEKCVGAAKIVRRLGTFTGSLSFQGEDGYTSVEATSVPGSLGTSAFRNCTTLRGRAARASAAPSPKQSGASLMQAGANAPAILVAVTDPAASRFVALSGESPSPGIGVIREAVARAPKRTFRFAPSLDSATLRPPAPFSGSATFHDPVGGPATLRGSLAVAFPGFETSLVGPGFDPPRLRLLPSPD